MFKIIMFPIDQSRETREAVTIVSDLVKTYNSRLILLSVVEKKATGESPTNGIMADEDAVAKLLDGAKALFAEQNIEAEVIEKEGMPSFIICDVADELDVNLIIMGSRGLDIKANGTHESVTHRVINLSPCPVLVVP